MAEIFIGLYKLTAAKYANEKVTICYTKEGGQGPEVVLNETSELTVTLGGEFSLVIQEVEGVTPPIAPLPGFPVFPLQPAPGRPVTLPGGPEPLPGGPAVQPKPPEGFLPPIGTLPPWYGSGFPVTLPWHLPQMPSFPIGGIPPWWGAGYPVTLPGGPEPLPQGPSVQPKPDVDGTTKPNPRPEGPDAGDLTKPGVPLAKPA